MNWLELAIFLPLAGMIVLLFPKKGQTGLIKGIGMAFVRTAVGEANVVDALKASGDEALLGGEGNGGVILPGVCCVRDSLSAMALTLSLLAAQDLAATLKCLEESLRSDFDADQSILVLYGDPEVFGDVMVGFASMAR